MGLRILGVTNALIQQTGYATCARNLYPRINEDSEHEIVHLAVSGMEHGMNITAHGVSVYPQSSQGGNLSVQDIPVLCQKEDIDLIWTQFDAWHVAQQLTNVMDQTETPPLVAYAPIDHDPLAPNWRPILNNTAMNVPYCEFGERVMREANVPEETIWDPIYHGTDTETYQPANVDKSQFQHVNQLMANDPFVLGHFKNNQGTRAAHDQVLAAFQGFLHDEDAWDDAVLYMHCSIRGSNAFDLDALVQHFGLGNNVIMPSESEYRWGMDSENLAMMYNMCDVLVNTVRGEGFGLPILEAQACGVPVITGAYSSQAELVNDVEGEIKWDNEMVDLDDPVIEAKRGWMVPVWDEELTLGKHSYRRRYNREHVVEAMKTAYNSPTALERKGKKAREWAKQHTWDDKAEQFVELFDHLEDTLWERDEETDVVWEKVSAEKGGVGALGGS